MTAYERPTHLVRARYLGPTDRLGSRIGWTGLDVDGVVTRRGRLPYQHQESGIISDWLPRYMAEALQAEDVAYVGMISEADMVFRVRYAAKPRASW